MTQPSNTHPYPLLPELLLRRKIVEQGTGLSRVTIYRLMAKGEFPQNISLGGGRVGWLQSEVAGWIDGRINLSRKAEGV